MKICSRRGSWLAAFACASIAACGGGKKAEHPEEPEPLERWETQDEWVLVSEERCVTGPFEIEVPDRDIEFGRRFVVEVFGARGLPLDTQMAYESGAVWNGWGWAEENVKGDHSACRAHDDDVVAEAPGREEGDPPAGEDSGELSPPGDVRESSGDADGETEQEPSLPTLDRFEGELPSIRMQATAIAWYPQGNPNYHSIDGILGQYYEGRDGDGFRFRFWFHRPVDMEGVVIRFRDEVLVPNEPIESYRASFAARVAAVLKRREGAEVEYEYEDEQEATARGKLPPPPKHEEIPDAPGPHVEWLPGYWEYHVELEDFVWTGGTFVVRAPPEDPATDDQAVARDVEVTAELEIPDDLEPRQIDDRVPPKPAPRRETIPPPPAVAGAVWVAGFWQLEGTTWHWVEGRWKIPERGVRFRAPSIEVRGGVKVYVPGGWSRRR